MVLQYLYHSIRAALQILNMKHQEEPGNTVQRRAARGTLGGWVDSQLQQQLGSNALLAPRRYRTALLMH